MTGAPGTTIRQSAGSAGELVLQGIGVSPGIVVGPAVLFGFEAENVPEYDIAEANVPAEIERFEDALIDARRQIRDIQRNVEDRMNRADASILDAHLMVLDDRDFIEEVLRRLQKKRKNAEHVLWTVADKYMTILSEVKDDYLRERVADVKDITKRILRNLGGKKAGAFREVHFKSIIIAADLAPSETASLPRDLVLGLATDLGSPTSHSAMMARAMEIPAVVGMRDVTARVRGGEQVLIDGNKGVLVVRPTQDRLRMYGKVLDERKHIEEDLTHLRNVPAETRDGRRLILSANIEMPEDVEAVLSHGAEGVGLFRSEYSYISGQQLPSEEYLTEGYSKVAKRLAPAPVIIRTIDIGGDKLATYLGISTEKNPFLGLRSIRLALAEPEIFGTQLRAILRASAHGNVKIMYPMISAAEEVVQANELLARAKDELRAASTPFDEDISVGVMIETPSAALTADLIAPHVKFFSIGTNDLIQYAMAVDRVNERVAYLYQPTHPGIIKLIRMTVEAGHRHGLWVGVCGEMAADPVLCPLLIGLGVDEISVAPAAVPLVKDVIRSVSMSETEELAAVSLSAKSSAEVMDRCRDLIRRVAPEIIELMGG